MRARSAGPIGVSLPTPELARTLPIAGPPVRRPDPDLISRLGAVGSATASAVMHRMGVRQTFIQGPLPRQPGAKVVGPAVTLQFMPHREDIVAGTGRGSAAYVADSDSADGDSADGDSADSPGEGVAQEEHVEKRSALWSVFETVQPGDVLVVQAFGDAYTGCMGEMLVTYFKGRGGAGIVVDGCVRDWPRIREIGTPIWTRGFTPNYASQASLFPWAYNVPDRVQSGAGDSRRHHHRRRRRRRARAGQPRRLVLQHTTEHEDWEEFSRLKLAEGGDLKKYYPLDDEGWAEYEAWRRRLKRA